MLDTIRDLIMNNTPWSFVIIGAAAVLIIGLILLLALGGKKKKKRKGPRRPKAKKSKKGRKGAGRNDELIRSKADRSPHRAQDTPQARPP